MKKDIDFKPVKNIHIAVVKEDGWKVYLLNRSSIKIENVLVTSRGYGEQGDEEQKTSILRHMIPFVEPGEYAFVEPIDESVFHLNNEYWISYYIESQVFDKKYIFLPDSIIDEHLIQIEELQMKGILHS